MNQRIVKNCFSRPLSIDEYLSVLRDTGHASAVNTFLYFFSKEGRRSIFLVGTLGEFDVFR